MYQENDTYLKTKDPFNDIQNPLERCHHKVSEIMMRGIT